MATITNFRLIRHLRAAPTAHVRHIRRGRLVREGTALSFWFRPLVSTVSELPVDEQELPLLFRAPTSDYQEVSVQATITYRIVAPDRAAERVDFGIDTRTGQWIDAPLEQLGTVLIEQAQQHAIAVVARRPLVDVLSSGIGDLRDVIDAGLRSDGRLQEIGIEIAGVRVVAVRADAETEKALQTPLREELHQEAAKASYVRRAAAVEQERAIAENELANKIELARQEEELVRQQGLNDRRRVTDEAEAQRIRTEANAQDVQVVAQANAERISLTGAAEAEVQQAKIAAYADARDGVLLALAVRDLAGTLPDVGQLVITPDLISSALARVGWGRAELEAGPS